MTRSIISTATTAMAIVALAAPTALARPADMPPSTAAAQAKQELRSPDVIDAATQQNKQDLRATSEYPSRPAQGEQANPRPDTAPQPAADSGIAWSMIGLGIAGLLAAAAIAIIVGRTRHAARARIAA